MCEAVLHLRPLQKKLSPGGEIGRHARLRGVCRKTCWFESSPGHLVMKALSQSGKAFFVLRAQLAAAEQTRKKPGMHSESGLIQFKVNLSPKTNS